MLSKLKGLIGRLPRLTARFHIAFGLSSVVTTVTLLALFTGFVPDRRVLLTQGRIDMAEAVASSTSVLIERGNLNGVRENLEFLVQRNPALDSIELTRQQDSSSVTIGQDSSVPDDNFILVPLYRGERKWGEIRFQFSDMTSNSWLERWRLSPFGLMLFMSLLCFPAFYFYLGKMLKELNPSAAVPGRVRNALDTIAEALIVVDKRGDIVLANAAFAELNGRTAESLLGVNASSLDWICSDDEPNSYPWIAALNNGDIARRVMIGFKDSQGQERKFMVNCSPVTGAKGRIGGVLISMDDITLLEEKERLLRKSMLVAEEANNAKSNFLSNMSHEIRTPMTAILGFTEVLKRGFNLSETDKHRHLHTISNSGEHLLELINDVLDLSKVESGAMDVESIPVNAVEISYEVVKVLQVKADEKNIDLELEILNRFPSEIESDPSRLRQVITNLVGNAIKFTEVGSVKVTLSYQESTNTIEISIVDTGIGMTPSQQESIFDAFTQADVSITRRFGGTGLGLSISHKLVEAMGGTLEVSSSLGQGSSFVVTLDKGNVQSCELLAPEELLASLSALNVTNNSSWQFSNASVLVVDDGLENRELLSLVLGELGLNLTLAENGLEGLELATANEYDTILMDIQMPVMDGNEAVKAMRSSGVTVPVIALTANAMKGYEEQLKSSGFSHYLTKPIDLDRLTELLASLLGGERIETSVACDAPIVSTLAVRDPRMKSIADRFMVKFGDQLESIKVANEAAQWQQVKDFAHWLKGSGGTVGFNQLTEPAQALEVAAQKHDLATCRELLLTLTQLSERLCSEDPGSVHMASGASNESLVTHQTSVVREVGPEVDTVVTSTLENRDPRFQSIIQRFIYKLQEQNKTLEQAYAQSDWEEMAKLGHWLKGSAGSVGFGGFTELAEKLEVDANRQDSQATRASIDAIAQYSQRIIRDQRDEVSPGKSA